MEVEVSGMFQLAGRFLCLVVPALVVYCVLSVLAQRAMKVRLQGWCNCEICHTYLTSSWSNQFDNLCDWYAHLLRNSLGKTIHIHVLGNTITANPENVEYMLKTRFDNFPKGKPFSAILGDFLGQGTFNVDGELWKFQRKMASRLIPLLYSSGAVLDLQDVFRRFSFDCRRHRTRR